MERGALEDCFIRLTEKGVKPGCFIAVPPTYEKHDVENFKKHCDTKL